MSSGYCQATMKPTTGKAPDLLDCEELANLSFASGRADPRAIVRALTAIAYRLDLILNKMNERGSQ